MLNVEKSSDYRKTETKPLPWEYRIKWHFVIALLYYHVAGCYGIYCLFYAKLNTLIFTIIIYWLSAFGVTAGTHRLWAHKTYKAKLPLEIFLMICQSMANQHTVIHWARDHRIHHKFSDTDSDPHNASRGLFYSHIGWLLVRKNEEVKKAGKMIDLADLFGNPVLMFQRRNAVWFIASLTYLIPSIIPKLWDETFIIAYHVNMLRYIILLNCTFTVNSVAHKWGNRPYDKNILACQSSIVTSLTLGEGFHNYHHTFPQDYRTGELGNNKMNFVTWFIDFCAWLGLAYDRKSMSEEMVRARALRTGDGTDLWCRNTSTFIAE